MVPRRGDPGGNTVTEERSPRQVLYALVSGGFLVVVLALTIGAAAAGLVPVWWTVVMLVTSAGSGLWGVLNWDRTGPILVASIGLFVLWTVGTLVLA
jgi:hypothetical protein